MAKNRAAAQAPHGLSYSRSHSSFREAQGHIPVISQSPPFGPVNEPAEACPRGWQVPASSPSLPLLLQVQNLGFFPIHGVMMKITVPIATRGGNRLLMLRDFFTDQVAVFPRDQLGRGQKETDTPLSTLPCLGGGRKAGAGSEVPNRAYVCASHAGQHIL